MAQRRRKVRSPVGRKVARVAYYLRNLARDLAPQALFRRQLVDILRESGRDAPEYISRRVNYYNKLDRVPDNIYYDSDIAHIPMAKSMYYYDLKEHARYFPRSLKLNYVFGDVTKVPDQPAFVKSRPVGGDNRNAILMKLAKFRHFYFPPDPLPFADKKPQLVWRGGRHNPQRVALVRRFQNHPLCDVGHPGPASDGAPAKAFLTPAEQMTFKYILSIEGNDVATNLKWILASNSLCFMLAPTFETWFMEGRLEPGRHYVELAPDFADLEDKLLFYEGHPAEALAIVRNANAYAGQFLDARRERFLSLLVMYKYFVVTGQLAPDSRLAGLMSSLAIA